MSCWHCRRAESGAFSAELYPGLYIQARRMQVLNYRMSQACGSRVSGLGGALWLGAFEWSKLLLWSSDYDMRVSPLH